MFGQSQTSKANKTNKAVENYSDGIRERHFNNLRIRKSKSITDIQQGYFKSTLHPARKPSS